MKIFRIILILMMVSFATTAHEVVVYDDPHEMYEVDDFGFLIDSTNTLTIQDIQNMTLANGEQGSFSGLKRNKNIWIALKYKVGQEMDHMSLLIDQANIDTVELFFQGPKGEWSKTLYGDNLPFDTRKFKTTHLIFEIPAQKEEHTLYLRIRNNVTTSFNILVGEQTTILAYENITNTLFAFIMGIITVMITYNLFLYVSIKESVYLIYVVLSFFTGLLQLILFGYSLQFLWPNTPSIQDFAIELFTIIATVGGLFFMNSFLKAKEFTPILYKVSKYIIGIYAILALMLFIDVPLVNMILLTTQPLISIFIFTTAFKSVLKGYPPAKFFLLAWSIFLLGIIVFVMAEVGIIERSIFTTSSIFVGAAIEVVLLSFALAHRINVLISEKQESVSFNYKLEIEKADLIHEQNIKLEKLVSDRTIQLKESNQELANRSTEIEEAYAVLKNTQSQLVNSAKMSSLGVLTAGIAHEINNPINFVKANIGPIKQDLNEMMQFMTSAEQIASESLPEREMAKIIRLKENMDFDYLKVEINQLLDGITEGANRTAEIVRGLNSFSRVHENDIKDEDLEQGIKSTLVLLNNSFKHQLKVTTKFAHIPKVFCHGGKMNQVFMNIMSNAIHSVSNSGKEGGEIVISTEQKGDNVEIRFKDNGLGMTDEVKNKLFEPFFTTKDVGEGVGLGLSIVYTIIQKSKGKIEVTSELGKGTEFIITLPITTQTTSQ